MLLPVLVDVFPISPLFYLGISSFLLSVLLFSLNSLDNRLCVSVLVSGLGFLCLYCVPMELFKYSSFIQKTNS